MRPSEEEALALHRKYGTSERIVEHCKTVARVARVLAMGLNENGKLVDVDAIVVGALLHDLGRTRTQTVAHGSEGASILQAEEVDPQLVEIVRRHVGAGISAEEAKRLGLPPFDYIPRSMEEAVVCFADKMVDGTLVRPFEAEVVRFRAKGHDVSRLEALKEKVEDELGEDPEQFIFDKIKASS